MNLAKHISDTELSAKILRHAVPQMSELNIPVTPDNYSVWYEYYRGVNLDLKRAIDGLLANGVTFTPEVNAGLHSNFVQEKSPEVIENVQIETQLLINNLISKIAKMSHGTETLSASLSGVQQELAQSPDEETLMRLIDGLAEEVTGVINNNAELAQSLKAMDEEVNSLKSEMENLNFVAMTDQLTSLHNRRAFEEQILSHIQDFRKKGVDSSLLVVDIDHFKAFNDTHGHVVGDKVLAYVALALKHGVRGEDFVARYGGEEFVLLLPDTNHSGALVVAEQLRQRIADKKLTIGKDKKLSLGNITVSVGVASLKAEDDKDSYFVRADEALYRAKSSGRNCVMG